MNQYDAIVIGAGHNGLTNGAYLAKAGLKVAVLERNPYIGGATVSRELHKGWLHSHLAWCMVVQMQCWAASLVRQILPLGSMHS